MSRYSKDMLAACAEWVRERGLMDFGGAKLMEFCAAMHIDDMTYYDWMRKPEFSEAIRKAKEDFRRGLQRRVEKSLAKAATGYEYEQRITEYGGTPGEDGSRPVRKETVKTMHVEPNVGAAIFLLTNLDPERWKNKQVQDISHTGLSLQIVSSDEGKANIEEIIDKG